MIIKAEKADKMVADMQSAFIEEDDKQVNEK